eukprot:6053782-Prymnesium_polylepis.1
MRHLGSGVRVSALVATAGVSNGQNATPASVDNLSPPRSRAAQRIRSAIARRDWDGPSERQVCPG